jgi:hypothetical protein
MHDAARPSITYLGSGNTTFHWRGNGLQGSSLCYDLVAEKTTRTHHIICVAVILDRVRHARHYRNVRDVEDEPVEFLNLVKASFGTALGSSYRLTGGAALFAILYVEEGYGRYANTLVDIA